MPTWKISPTPVELWAPEIAIFWNIIIFKNGKVDSLRGLDAAENTHYIQKCFKWRKSRLQGLLMFSNVFQELSVSPSAVNYFKVTNLCKNGIHIHDFWVQNLTEFYFILKFHDESKIRTIVPKYFHSTLLNSKTKFLKIPEKSTHLPKTLEIFPRFLQNFPKIFNYNFLGMLSKIFLKFLWNCLNNYGKICT